MKPRSQWSCGQWRFAKDERTRTNKYCEEQTKKPRDQERAASEIILANSCSRAICGPWFLIQPAMRVARVLGDGPGARKQRIGSGLIFCHPQPYNQRRGSNHAAASCFLDESYFFISSISPLWSTSTTRPAPSIVSPGRIVFEP